MTEYDSVPAGVAYTLAPGLRRILAPNPSPMTHRGTNSYLVGKSGIAVIDPGPDDPVHLAALLRALGPGQHVSHIVVTHPHRDHSALAPRLAAATGAPILAFGRVGEGRSAAMTELARSGTIGGGEGIDADFAPDHRLVDGETVEGDDWRLTALWTPGHMSSHLSLVWQDMLFSGDLVMGWASTLISPPDGDLERFLNSCARLADRRETRFLPGHGAPIDTPQARCRDLIAHRRSRHAQLSAALSHSPQSIAALTTSVYPDLAPPLRPAAERNVLAHLVAMVEHDEARAIPALSPRALFVATGNA